MSKYPLETSGGEKASENQAVPAFISAFFPGFFFPPRLFFLESVLGRVGRGGRRAVCAKI
jgi:hypothetical protein